MKAYKTVSNLSQDSPNPDPGQLNCDKIHIIGFRKTRDNGAVNDRTKSSNKSQ